MVSSALEQTIAALRANPAPETVISQAFTGLEFGDMPTDPQELIERHVQSCIRRYLVAAGFAESSMTGTGQNAD